MRHASRQYPESRIFICISPLLFSGRRRTQSPRNWGNPLQVHLAQGHAAQSAIKSLIPHPILRSVHGSQGGTVKFIRPFPTGAAGWTAIIIIMMHAAGSRQLQSWGVTFPGRHIMAGQGQPGNRNWILNANFVLPCCTWLAKLPFDWSHLNYTYLYSDLIRPTDR